MTPFDFELIIKILIAAFFGAFIGIDRQLHNKPAGTRTLMLLCVGSALLGGISVSIGQLYGADNRTDPTRLMAQIITGIGFLGAGVILKENNRISGVTTAATIWITAAIGISVGAGYYIPATIATILVLFLHPLAKLEYKFGLKRFIYSLQIPREQWMPVTKMMEENNISYTVNTANANIAQFTIHSSESAKKKITNELTKEHIHFELFEEEE